ncbi:MAG: GNAT family N-acetyltransferase [Thermoplasmata archaeon]
MNRAPEQSEPRPPDAGGRGDVEVRPAVESDLGEIASIGSEAFSGLRPVEEGRRWVEACWRAAPRMQYWVALTSGTVVGYILWLEKGGFRRDAVLELEQVAVRPTLRGQGVGEALIRRSLDDLRRALRARGSQLKLVEVTTGTEQGALGFYARVLGTEVAARIPDFFRGDECILIAREPPRVSA